MSVPVHLCAYCDEPTVCVHGSVVYPHLAGLATKSYWLCRRCQAWVGCHPGTTNPLGRTAKADLRDAKSAAHAALDPLWRDAMVRDGVSKGSARRAIYRWLAGELGIERGDCHIGMFDVLTCNRVVQMVRDLTAVSPHQHHISPEEQP